MVTIEEGMRIAQMIIVPVRKVKIKEVKTLSKSQRSGKPIGCTGLK
jgi:dUTPase